MTLSVMIDKQSFGASLLEAAKGFALFSALMSLFVTPFLASGILFYILSKLFNEPILFPVGIVLGLLGTIASVLKIKQVMKEYNFQIWK